MVCTGGGQSRILGLNFRCSFGACVAVRVDNILHLSSRDWLDMLDSISTTSTREVRGLEAKLLCQAKIPTLHAQDLKRAGNQKAGPAL